MRGTRRLPPPCPGIRCKADKDLTQNHSLCLHSQPPLTRAISSKGLSRMESGGTCQRSQDTQISQFNAAPEREAPSPAFPREPGAMQDCVSKQTRHCPPARPPKALLLQRMGTLSQWGQQAATQQDREG